MNTERIAHTAPTNDNETILRLWEETEPAVIDTEAIVREEDTPAQAIGQLSIDTAMRAA